MAKREKSPGDYSELSPQVVELAYSMNESYNLGQALAKAKSEVKGLEKSDADNLASSLLALKESGIAGDELLKGYDKIIRINSDGRRIERFEEMLLLGARLVPGEVVRIDGEVLVIAAPEDDTEAFAPTPLVVETGRTHGGDAIFGFEWAVPVVGKEEMAQVHNRTTVGKDAVKKELDDLHRYGDESPLTYLMMADSYRTIEEPESAERFKALAIKEALHELRDVNVHTDSSDMRVASCLEILDKTGTLDQFLDEVSLGIFQDDVDSVKIAGGRYSLLHNYLAYRKVKRGECDRIYRARVDFEELTGLWFLLKSRGKALLELQRDQNEQ